MTPTKKVPTPIVISIEQLEGYTIEADGELNPDETYILPGPSPVVQIPKHQRLRASRPPTAQKLSQVKTPTLGSISPSVCIILFHLLFPLSLRPISARDSASPISQPQLLQALSSKSSKNLLRPSENTKKRSTRVFLTVVLMTPSLRVVGWSRPTQTRLLVSSNCDCLLARIPIRLSHAKLLQEGLKHLLSIQLSLQSPPHNSALVALRHRVFRLPATPRAPRIHSVAPAPRQNRLGPLRWTTQLSFVSLCPPKNRARKQPHRFAFRAPLPKCRKRTASLAFPVHPPPRLLAPSPYPLDASPARRPPRRRSPRAVSRPRPLPKALLVPRRVHGGRTSNVPMRLDRLSRQTNLLFGS